MGSDLCCWFVEQIPGTKGVVGTSNIQENCLSFDLSVFKSLLQIEVGTVLWTSLNESEVNGSWCAVLAVYFVLISIDQWLWLSSDQWLAFSEAHSGYSECPSLYDINEGTGLLWMFRIQSQYLPKPINANKAFEGVGPRLREGPWDSATTHVTLTWLGAWMYSYHLICICSKAILKINFVCRNPADSYFCPWLVAFYNRRSQT